MSVVILLGFLLLTSQIQILNWPFSTPTNFLPPCLSSKLLASPLTDPILSAWIVSPYFSAW